MHPDAAYIHSNTWSADTPNIQSGIAVLSISAKRTSTVHTESNAREADEIAAKLITDPVIASVGISLFNRVPFRHYTGSGLTDYATRRGY